MGNREICNFMENQVKTLHYIGFFGILAGLIGAILILNGVITFNSHAEVMDTLCRFATLFCIYGFFYLLFNGVGLFYYNRIEESERHE